MPSRFDRAGQASAAACALVFAGGFSLADVVPQTSVAMLVDADSAVFLNLAPTEINLEEGVTFLGEELAEDGAWRVGWELNTSTNSNDDEILFSRISTENFSMQPQRFVVYVLQPACGTESSDAYIGGVVSMTLISDSDGGAVTTTDAPAWSAIFDGETASNQFLPPFQMTASGKSIIQTSQVFGAPFPALPSPGLDGPATIKIDFTLTPGDRVELNSTVFVGEGKEYEKQPGPNPCPADFTNDGEVNAEDLASLLAAWGVEYECLPGDLNEDFVIDNQDIAILLAAWGACEG